jgi:hypothetical protein
MKIKNRRVGRIIVRTQEELDALPDKFRRETYIEIRANPSDTIKIQKSIKRGQIVMCESSRAVIYNDINVQARDQSHVTVRNRACVDAYDYSCILAYESSRVYANHASRVYARDASRVFAGGSSYVVARDSSRVKAEKNSRVRSLDMSRVVARDQSIIEARGHSHVVARDSSSVVALSSYVVIVHLAEYAVARLRGAKPKIERKDDTAVVIEEPRTL